MQLKAEPEHAGRVVRCPGCNTKLQVPASPNTPAPDGDGALPPPAGGIEPGSAESQQELMEQATEQQQSVREGWVETDPTNASIWVSLGIGTVITLAFLGILMAFAPGPDVPSSDFSLMQYLANVWKGHLPVNGLNTLFFFWAMAMLWLKWKKLKHQRQALLLDVLPADLGGEISSHTVGAFIDHVYGLPRRLRDSMMVNRIRKGLELFEMKQNTSDAVALMSAQSDIDSSRIGGSYSPVKAFLWAIPILGFVGTVLGLSHALLSLNFTNMDKPSEMVGVLQGVIGGLGGAFDATLVGLVFAMFLNFPMNALMKAEDDNLNDIDSFCNEVLIPRLNDGGDHAAAGNPMGMMDELARAVSSAQKEFLGDLNTLSAKIVEQAHNLDRRADAHQQVVAREFITMLNKMREDMTGAVQDSVKMTTDYTRALSSGIVGLNTVLKELGDKQVVVHQTVKKSWFSKG